MTEAAVYYCGGTSFGRGLGPQGVILMTRQWSGMFDCGLELGLPWPHPDHGFDQIEFNTERERKLVHVIARNDVIPEHPYQWQDVYRSWARGPAFKCRDDRNPFLKGLKLDFICDTHGHTDHIGGSGFLPPYLYPHALTYGSPHTEAVKPLVLKDTKKLSPYLFSKNGEEIDEMLERRAPIHLGVNNITPDGIWAGIAGHTPGAVSYEITLPNGKVVEASGDRAWHWQWMVCGSTLPDEIPDSHIPDSIIMTDFTYAGRRDVSWMDDQKALLRSIGESLDKHRPVVINTYANAKGVGLASALSQGGVKVYIDGMIRHILDICLEHQNWAGGRYPNLHTENIVKIKNQYHRLEVIKEIEQNGGAVVTTSAGGEGPSRQYQRAGLHDRRWHFIIVGWTPDESPMGQTQQVLIDSPLNPVMSWSDRPGEKRIIEVRATVERHSASGHGDLNDWETYLGKLVARREGRLLDKIIVNHCVEHNKRHVVAAIERFAQKVEMVTRNQRFFKLY